MYRNFSFLLILLILESTCLFARNDSTKIIFNASVRERLELWDGMNAKNFGDQNGIGDLNDKMLLQRIIVGFNCLDKIRFRAVCCILYVNYDECTSGGYAKFEESIPNA